MVTHYGDWKEDLKFSGKFKKMVRRKKTKMSRENSKKMS